MKLSVLIPVFNERRTIATIIKAVEKAPLPAGMTREIVIVDDGSTDGTADLLKDLGKHTLVFHSNNKGKGAAIRTAMRHASGDVFLIQDADLEYDPREYGRLLAPLLDGCSVVYGSRFKRSDGRMRFHGRYYLGNLALTFFHNLVHGGRLTDMLTCYKVFRRNVVQDMRLRENGFAIEAELTAKILRQGHRICEVPICYAPRNAAQGKKIAMRHGISIAIATLRYGLVD